MPVEFLIYLIGGFLGCGAIIVFALIANEWQERRERRKEMREYRK